MNDFSSVKESPPPGQTHPVVTPEAIAAAEAIEKVNRRVTVCCMERNGDYIEKEVIVYHLCTINYEIKILKVFIRLTIVKRNSH